MPLAQISILEGRDPDAIARMAVAVTDAIASTLSAPRDRIRVVVTEVPPDRWFVAGTSLAASSQVTAGDRSAHLDGPADG